MATGRRVVDADHRYAAASGGRALQAGRRGLRKRREGERRDRRKPPAPDLSVLASSDTTGFIKGSIIIIYSSLSSSTSLAVGELDHKVRSGSCGYNVRAAQLPQRSNSEERQETMLQMNGIICFVGHLVETRSVKTLWASRATSPKPEEPAEGLWAWGQGALYKASWYGLSLRRRRGRWCQERVHHVSGSEELVEVAIERRVSTAAPRTQNSVSGAPLCRPN